MPSSWELEAKGPRVCVCVPIWDRMVSINWARSLRSMEWPDGTDSYIITGLPIGQARNKCVEHILQNNYTHLLFMDCDVVASPNALVKLLSHNLDIVSALYYTKFDPVRPVAYKQGVGPEGNPIKIPLPSFQFGDLVEVDYVGAGFILVHRRVFESIPPPWYEWTLDVHQPHGACAIPGQEVLGSSAIETIKVGDPIYNQYGIRSHVKRVYRSQYIGRIITITPKILKMPLIVTPEHQVLVLLSPRCYANPARLCKVRRTCKINRHRCQNPVWLHYNPIWLQAQDVKPGMYIAFPKISGHSTKKSINVREYIPELWKKKLMGKIKEGERTHKGRWTFPEVIPITDEFLELCGWYVAEGCTSGKKDIRLCFGPHEKELADRAADHIKQIFGISSWVTRGDHAWNAGTKSPTLYRLFSQWFGIGANNKKIPDWILQLPRKQSTIFLRALWEGDGHESYTGDHNPIICYRTSSKILAHQISALLIKLGIHHNVRHYMQPITSFSEGKGHIWHIVVSNDCGKLCWMLGRKSDGKWRDKIDRNKSFFWDKKLWFPISEVTTAQYSGLVYDLEVESGSSYVLGPAVVHNSEDFSFCERCRQHGFHIHLATEIQCEHELRATSSYRGLEIELL